MKNLKWVKLPYGGEVIVTSVGLISVSWDSSVRRGEPTGYKHTVFGTTTKGFYYDLDVCKEMAIKSAKMKLKAACEELGGV